MASLFVYMNGHEVGEYIQRTSGAQEFNYFDSWLDNTEAVPISLSLPLIDKTHKGEKVFNYFDNLLPDSMEIRNRIQARFGADTNRPFELLSNIGRDCAGAIQLVNERNEIDVKRIEGIKLCDEEIAEELRNYEAMPLGMSGNQEFRISIAGAQEKTALLMHEGGWKRPIGTTPTTHIFKLPIGKIEHAGIDLSNSVENEWLCLEILKGFGIPVPTAEIKVFEDSKVLVVERFDRKFSDDDRWIIRHPIEDMCQVNGISPGRKYESDGGPGISKIMEVLGSSLRPEEDRKLFMQTVFLFWLLGAPDGHAKNFSIFLKKGGRFQLTPIYDVISAYPLVGNREYDRQKVIMAMALSGKNRHYKWGEMLPRHWFEESRKSNFHRTEMQMIIEQTLSKLDRVIQKVVSELPKSVPDDISTSIFDGMKEAARRFGSLDNS